MTISILQQLISLTKQLLPTGRAFRIPKNSVKEKVNRAIVSSEQRLYNDGLSILDTILPDNDNFKDTDAERWEIRLGMIDGTGLDLEVRKQAIIRKYNHPGNILARQSSGYMQDQLRLAGFDVYVYDNVPVETIIGFLSNNTLVNQAGDCQAGDCQAANVLSLYASFFQIVQAGDCQAGDCQAGQPFFIQKAVNSIDYLDDLYFHIESSFRSVFYIGGPNPSDIATVDQNRRQEFRQLILKIKPTRTKGFLLINYI